MDVVCTGRLTTFPGQSKYQLVIESISLAGIGALLKILEERKKKLEAEGLFDPSRKKAIPFLPRIIGVVTSPTGAVIRDILHRLDERFPRHVLIWPVAVQGEGAAEQIAAAVTGFNVLPLGQRPDVLIIARGGGSVEDLMAFNEENVVRAVAASSIPVISAVGHETDTTLIDFASDLRAPTPTAAAEKAVPVRGQLILQVSNDGARLIQALVRLIQDRSERLRLVQRAMGDPLRAIEPLAQRLDSQTERLVLSWSAFFERKLSRVKEVSGRLRHPRDIVGLALQRLANAEQKMDYTRKDIILSKTNRLETLGTVLKHLSPRNVLGRGYALVQNIQGDVISSTTQLKRGDKIIIEFQDGTSKAIAD
jgi:exodeoxyribonuclease VII large subunit